MCVVRWGSVCSEKERVRSEGEGACYEGNVCVMWGTCVL